MKLIVLYDSWCPLCQAVKKNIHRLDWFKLIEFKTIRAEDTWSEIPLEKLVKEMHCMNQKSGKVTVGIDAIASICARIPVLAFLWLPVKLSSMVGIGHVVYNYIAKTRKIVPVGHCDLNGVCERE